MQWCDMSSEAIEMELQKRYFDLCRNVGESEVLNGFPTLKRINCASVVCFLKLIAALEHPQKLEMVKLFQKRAYSRIAGELSPKEELTFRYFSGSLGIESLKEDDQRSKIRKRISTQAFANALIAKIGNSLGPITRLGNLEWQFVLDADQWKIVTDLEIERNIVRYCHNISTGRPSRFRSPFAIGADLDYVLPNISSLGDLGLGAETEFDLKVADSIESLAHAIRATIDDALPRYLRLIDQFKK